LTLQEARRGLEMAKEQLRSETVIGSAYWLCPGTVVEKSHGPQALLLSLYDEYTIA
jgi:hypothetical protein